MPDSRWPDLKYEAWKSSAQTLHRWLQIVGKVRLSKSPWTNHSWHSTLYVTEKGLTTSVIHDREVSFTIDLDFLVHRLDISRSDGERVSFPLIRESVAQFYGKCISGLRNLGIETAIWASPNELPDATPFSEDTLHCSYDPAFVTRFWRVLLQCDRIMKIFRARFIGKASPVHLFWGSMDIAVTRFSGNPAPEHPGGVPHLPDLVAREAYSHEVSSCGFWPGSELFPAAAFYSYAYPQPPGFDSARVVEGAYFDRKLREFILPYEIVRQAEDPGQLLLQFFQMTYEAAADLGQWDRQRLEDSPYLKLLRERSEGRKPRISATPWVTNR